VLAFKQVMAGAADAATQTKSIGSGRYTYWLDSTAQQVINYTAVSGAAAAEDCLDTCTIDLGCYAVRIQLSSNGSFEGCGVIKPELPTNQWSSSRRTLTRAVPERSNFTTATSTYCSTSGQCWYWPSNIKRLQ
jgi:hypothetical protein